MAKLRLLLATLLLTLTVNANALDAPAALVPAGLNPGDTFYVMFVTSTFTAGNLASADYPAAANAAADLSGAVGTDDPSITWGAWYAHDDGTVSSAALFAANNTRPIYRTDGTIIANNYADLIDGTILNPINITEDGATVRIANVYTGLLSSGIPMGLGDNTLGGTDGSTDGCGAGSSNAVDSNWTFTTLTGGVGCTGSLPLYAVSPLLTVPAARPIPTMSFWGLGLMGLLLIAVARRRMRS